MVFLGASPHNIPRNYHEAKYSGLKQGDATTILVDLDKYNNMVKGDAVNMKIINCGKVPHDNKKLTKLFKRCKQIDYFLKIDKEIILQDGTLDDLFFLKVADFANELGVQKGDLPVGCGPGGEWLTQHKAANKKFQTMAIGFEIVDGQIQIGGGIKMVDMLHGNSVFYDHIQKAITEQFVKQFNTRFTYYIIVYQPEPKGLF
jgi:hypothetical protein